MTLNPETIFPKWAGTPGILVVALTFMTFLPPTAVAQAGSRPPDKTIPFRLGGLRIGETLSHFKESFSGSACGTTKSTIINRHTLEDPDDSGYLICCLDDSNSLAKFSERRIVAVNGQCPVILGFWKERLFSLWFTVEVPSIEDLLPSFEKTYGPAHQMMHGSAPHDQLSLASWWHGDEQLDLSIAIFEAIASPGNSSANGKAEHRLVQVSMWLICCQY
jgi:hypothetical protein